jgi:hypothetical protein
MKCREVRIYLRKRNGSLDNGEGYEVACPELQLTFRQEREVKRLQSNPGFYDLDDRRRVRASWRRI